MNTLETNPRDKLSRVEKMTMAACTTIGFPFGLTAWFLSPEGYTVERLGLAAIAFAIAFSALGGLLGSMGFMAKPKATYYMSGVIYVILYFNSRSTFPISFLTSWWGAFAAAICISVIRQNRSKRHLPLGLN